MDSGGSAYGFRSNLRQADVADVAGLDHVCNGTDGVFDGDIRVEASGAVDVDVFNAEALEGIGEGSFDGGWACVVAEPCAIGPPLGAELDGDQNLLAKKAKSLCEQHLVMAHAIKVAGIEQGDSGVDRGVNG